MKPLGIGDLGLWGFVRRHPILTAKSYWKWRGYLWRYYVVGRKPE